MLVYYSLGNFISTQKDPVCLLGGMADITIVRDPVSDALSIRNADLVPLVTHYNHDQNIYTVYKLSDYTEELAASHGVHAESTEPFTLEKGADSGLSHPGLAPVFFSFCNCSVPSQLPAE